MMTICHVTPSGEKQTLTMPIAAAEAHLREHPLDFPGICPIEEPTPPSVETETSKIPDISEILPDPVTPEEVKNETIHNPKNGPLP